MNQKKLLLLAFIIAITLAGDTLNQQSNLSGELTPKTVYPLIDAQLKSEWWQYLRGAK